MRLNRLNELARNALMGDAVIPITVTRHAVWPRRRSVMQAHLRSASPLRSDGTSTLAPLSYLDCGHV